MSPSSDHTSQPSLWIESPEVRTGPVARVAMKVPVDGEYSYTVPDDLADDVEPGRRVMVPFGRGGKNQVAFCLSVSHEPWTSSLRPIAEVIDDRRHLSDDMIELGRWIARYYACPLGRTLAAMVPEAARKQSGFRTVRVYRVSPGSQDAPPRSARRRAVLETLREAPEGLDADALKQRGGASAAILNNMVKSGHLRMTTRREPAPAPDFDRPGDEPTFELNQTQQEAIRRIVELAEAGRFRAMLLFGVSGSGKTEVYIRSIRNLLERGRQAILLVPEIALTTQIVDRLASRFRDVAVIHSGLTGVQRSLTFAAIARGEKKVVIGTRSAVFAPCPDLGLIVVDEEQDASYKNQQSPRFQTRDVAIKRAQMASIPIVLGSATPSLETWHNCRQRDYFESVTLPDRVAGLPMPSVDFVDMQIEQRQRKGIHLLSRQMEQTLSETLDAGQQAVLLLNLRGYANYLVCSRCRTPIVCPNCQVYMVFHQTTGKVQCHHCGSRMVVPAKCGDPSCRGTLIRFGMGTQRVEEELGVKFADARIARADSDTMKRPEHYAGLVQSLQNREIDVLIGTQMIAKGLDFPHVAFVGVVSADTAASQSDFRAAERTFQLVTQVAGRAGRAQAGGRVVVQSLIGLSPALQFAANHDYDSFAAHELELRQRFGWPPFARLARVLVSHSSQAEARNLAQSLADRIRDEIHTRALPADVLGPQTAPRSRLRNQYRFDFQLRAANANRLLELLDHLRHADILTPNTPHTLIDVDPVSLH